MVAQQCECTKGHRTVHFKMVRMVNFLCQIYLNFFFFKSCCGNDTRLRVHPVWFHLCKILKQAKLTHNKRKLVVAQGEAGAGGGGLSITKGLSGVEEMCCIKICQLHGLIQRSKFTELQVLECALFLSEEYLQKCHQHTSTSVIIVRNTHIGSWADREKWHTQVNVGSSRRTEAMSLPAQESVSYHERCCQEPVRAQPGCGQPGAQSDAPAHKGPKKHSEWRCKKCFLKLFNF